MRILQPAVIIGLLLALTGCTDQEDKKLSTAATNSMTLAGLKVSLTVPDREFAPGERFEAAVTVENVSDRTVTLAADSAAPVYVRLWRHPAIGWDEIRQYPWTPGLQGAARSLPPGYSQTHTMELTVEPNWPTNEFLRLTAEANGMPQLMPGVSIMVLPAAVEDE